MKQWNVPISLGTEEDPKYVVHDELYVHDEFIEGRQYFAVIRIIGHLVSDDNPIDDSPRRINITFRTFPDSSGKSYFLDGAPDLEPEEAAAIGKALREAAAIIGLEEILD